MSPEPGSASLEVVREIDARLEEIERELSAYEELVSERQRLRAARSALTGERVGAKRITQDEIADYLAEHPGSRSGEIARVMGVPLATVSSHLYRGKRRRFESRHDGWYLRTEQAGEGE